MITAAFAAAAFAQKDGEKAAALAMPDRLFDAMEQAEPAAITDLFVPGAQVAARQRQKDGSVQMRFFTVAQFADMFNDKNVAMKEIMYAPKVQVSGDWAAVSGRYVFFVNKKLSHCGINQMNLFRTEAGWKIANATTTIDASDCTDAEKKMKAEPAK